VAVDVSFRNVAADKVAQLALRDIETRFVVPQRVITVESQDFDWHRGR
jgi:hypothetical protein